MSQIHRFATTQNVYFSMEPICTADSRIDRTSKLTMRPSEINRPVVTRLHLSQCNVQIASQRGHLTSMLVGLAGLSCSKCTTYSSSMSKITQSIVQPVLCQHLHSAQLSHSLPCTVKSRVDAMINYVGKLDPLSREMAGCFKRLMGRSHIYTRLKYSIVKVNHDVSIGFAHSLYIDIYPILSRAAPIFGKLVPKSLAIHVTRITTSLRVKIQEQNLPTVCVVHFPCSYTNFASVQASSRKPSSAFLKFLRGTIVTLADSSRLSNFSRIKCSQSQSATYLQ